MEHEKRPNREDFLVFGKPVLEDEDIQAVLETLRSGWIGTGPKVKEFEEVFAGYLGAKHAVAVNSCTAALHLALIVAGVGQGDEVITSPLTFASTANVILHVGAKPVFVDVELATQNIDPDRIEEAISHKTRAIIPVHFAGRPCDMEPIQKLSADHNLRIIEDAAHALSAKYHGQSIGTLGDLAAFSFYATKELITGEGGMLVTTREDWAQEAGQLRLHGLSRDAWARFSNREAHHYEVTAPGFKYNMTDIQASMAIPQMKRIETNLRRREEIWSLYDDSFKSLPLVTPAQPQPDTRHARHLYTLLLEVDAPASTRDSLLDDLHTQNIGAGIHYISLHNQPYYKETFDYVEGDFPNANSVSKRTFSLPLSAGMTDEDGLDVISAVHRFFDG